MESNSIRGFVHPSVSPLVHRSVGPLVRRSVCGSVRGLSGGLSLGLSVGQAFHKNRELKKFKGIQVNSTKFNKIRDFLQKKKIRAPESAWVWSHPLCMGPLSHNFCDYYLSFSFDGKSNVSFTEFVKANIFTRVRYWALYGTWYMSDLGASFVN